MHVAEVLDGKRCVAVVLGRTGRQHAGPEPSRPIDQIGVLLGKTEGRAIEDRRIGMGLVEVAGVHRGNRSGRGGRKRVAQEADNSIVECSRGLEIGQVSHAGETDVARAWKSCPPCARRPQPERWGLCRRQYKARDRQSSRGLHARRSRPDTAPLRDRSPQAPRSSPRRHTRGPRDRRKARSCGRPFWAPDRPWSCRHRAAPTCRRRTWSGTRRRRCRRPGSYRRGRQHCSRAAVAATPFAPPCRPSNGRPEPARSSRVCRSRLRRRRPAPRSPSLRPEDVRRILASPALPAQSRPPRSSPFAAPRRGTTRRCHG